MKKLDLDKMEKDARERFEAKKAEGVACEKVIAEHQQKLIVIGQELSRIQGEYKVIQNLKAQTRKAEGGKKLTANKK